MVADGYRNGFIDRPSGVCRTVTYNGGEPNYSAVITNQNFSTDTNATASVMLPDMSPYTMLVEFIAIANTKNVIANTKNDKRGPQL